MKKANDILRGIDFLLVKEEAFYHLDYVCELENKIIKLEADLAVAKTYLRKIMRNADENSMTAEDFWAVANEALEKIT